MPSSQSMIPRLAPSSTTATSSPRHADRQTAPTGHAGGGAGGGARRCAGGRGACEGVCDVGAGSHSGRGPMPRGGGQEAMELYRGGRHVLGGEDGEDQCEGRGRSAPVGATVRASDAARRGCGVHSWKKRVCSRVVGCFCLFLAVDSVSSIGKL